MKKRPDDTPRTSRRQFTKAVAAAIAAAPLAACAPGANQNSNQNSNQTNANQTNANQNKASQTGAETFKLRSDHEPPTIFGDSFHLELHHKLGDNGENAPDSGRPRYRHIAKNKDDGHQYGPISVVYVYTQFQHSSTHERLPFEASENAQLRLWLRDVENGANPDDYEPIRPEDKPEVIISGGTTHPEDASIKTLLFESDNRRLDFVKKTAKKYRREKYEHKNKGNNKDFRIAKWDILKADGTIAAGNNSNDTVVLDGEPQHAHRYAFMLACYGA